MFRSNSMNCVVKQINILKIPFQPYLLHFASFTYALKLNSLQSFSSKDHASFLYILTIEKHPQIEKCDISIVTNIFKTQHTTVTKSSRVYHAYSLTRFSFLGRLSRHKLTLKEPSIFTKETICAPDYQVRFRL